MEKNMEHEMETEILRWSCMTRSEEKLLRTSVPCGFLCKSSRIRSEYARVKR